jgi:hypothetical protein
MTILLRLFYNIAILDNNNNSKVTTKWIDFFQKKGKLKEHSATLVERGLKGNQIYCEGACGHMALWNFRLRFEPSGLSPLTKLVIDWEFKSPNHHGFVGAHIMV